MMMPFSKLLLVSANSQRYIEENKDKVILKELRNGELALFFKIDEYKVKMSLNMVGEGQKCCDGLIFFSQDTQNERVICLVEMKSKSLEQAAEQIRDSYKVLKGMIDKEREECRQKINVVWKACLFMHKCSLKDKGAFKHILIDECKIASDNILFLDRDKNDIGPLLRGENGTDQGKKSKKKGAVR
jgi:hypothetical protein